MFLKYNTAGILWAIFILMLCLIPGSAFPRYSWAELLSIDKFIHAVLFVVLVILLIKGFRIQNSFLFLNRKTITAVLVFSIVYGGLLELMQHYCLVDRTGDWFDFIANTVGCLTGIPIYRYLKKRNIKIFGFTV